jgi:hypothetical protein
MVTVDHPGLYDLRALGHAEPIVLSDTRRSSAYIEYRVPAAVHRRYPYAKVYLRFRARIAPGTTNGFGYVNMETGHGLSASAEVQSERHDRRLRFHWDTVTVKGETDYYTASSTYRIDYPNYMLFDDATPGRHRLRFALEQYKDIRFDRVEIDPRSGISLTDRSPFPKPVRPSVRTVTRVAPIVGRPVTLAVRILNPYDRPARDLTVKLTPDSGLRIVGAEAQRRWRDLQAGEAAERRVRVVPRTSGQHVLSLAATASTGTSSGRLVLRAALAEDTAAGSGEGGGTSPLVWIGLGALALAGAATATRSLRSR